MASSGCGGSDSPAGSGGSELRTVSGAFGNLRMYVFEPTNPAPAAGLVVALHGCTQSAADYRAAGWEAIAEEHGFYVVYAETSANNRCFAWWEPSQTSRGRGEAAAIAAMVARARADYAIDPSKVFVTGLSAGGAMTAVMLATYPDVFSAGSVIAGIPYRCASSQTEAFSCMFSDPMVSQAQWVDRVELAAPPGFTPPRVSVWHGTSDYTVREFAGEAVVSQWTGVHGLDDTPDRVETVGMEQRELHTRADGTVAVERWVLPSMGHGTPVDPARGCGRAGAFILDRGTCSSQKSAEFFGLVAPTDPPPLDAGTPDAGTPDAGASDAGTPDAGASDAGTPDAGASDAGTSDAGASDAGTPDAGASDAGTPDAGTCREFTSSNYAHQVAGRAYNCGGYACAVGSGQRMGLLNVFYTSTLREVSAGYYEIGACSE